MKKTSSNGNSHLNDFRKDSFWATKVGFYMLWMEYLAISPSYELARRFRADALSPDTLCQPAPSTMSMACAPCATAFAISLSCSPIAFALT
jgi:hypothetical protein